MRVQVPMLVLCLVASVLAAPTPSFAVEAAQPAAAGTPELFPGRSYSAGTQEESVATDDLNGDGHEDLAVANAWGGVSVLLGKGDGSFQEPVTYPTAAGAITVATGDLNNDGHPDLAVAMMQDSSNLSIYLNNGDGTFADGVTYNLSRNRSITVVIGDFNRDGNQDVIVGDFDFGGLHVLLGKGDGTFRAQADFASAGAARSMTVGDLNGDDKLDLVVTTSAGCCGLLSVILGNGDGSFQEPVALPAGSRPYAVAIHDLDGDNKLDLAIANFEGNTVTLKFGLGDGTFEPGVTVPAGSGPHAVAVGDLNGDHIPDISVANSFGNSVSVLIGKGGRLFEDQESYGAGHSPLDLVLGDFDEDGDADLAVSGGYLVVLVGNGDGTFQGSQLYPAGSVPGQRAVAPGDLNSDGAPDLVTGNSGSGDVSVLVNKGDGNLHQSVNYVAGSSPRSLALGDLNNDGDVDVAVANADVRAVGDSSGVTILLGHGVGTLSPGGAYLVGKNLESVVIGDLNGDGRPDLVATNPSPDHRVSVLLGQGDGTFGAAAQYAAGAFPFALALGDLDSDADLDIVVGNVSSPDVSVLVGNGDGTFQPARNLPADLGNHRSVAIGDVDRDGKPDIAAVSTSFGRILVFRGNGDGTFQPAQRFAAGSNPSSVAIGDVSGDFIPDLAVTTDNLVVLVGNGDATFQGPRQYAASTAPSGIAVADLNGDGNRDVVVGNAGGPLDAGVSVLLSLLPPSAGAPTLSLSATGPPSVAVEGGKYAPDPFTIMGSVKNTGLSAAADVNLVLSLPPGLAFASGSLSQEVGTIPPGEQRQRTWSVRATGSSRDTVLRYFVSASASNANSSPVIGELAVPALFGVSAFVPSRGGNAGRVTVEIYGSGFLDGATPHLGTVVGQETALLSSERLRTTFDLREQPPGPLPLRVTNPGGGMAAASGSFEVVEGGAPDVTVDLVAPAFVRRALRQPLIVPFFLVAQNRGLVDAEDVPVFLGARVPGSVEGSSSAPSGSGTAAVPPSSSISLTIGGSTSTSFDVDVSNTTYRYGDVNADRFECVDIYVVCGAKAKEAALKYAEMLGHYVFLAKVLLPATVAACATPVSCSIAIGSFTIGLLTYANYWLDYRIAVQELNLCLLAHGFQPNPVPGPPPLMPSPADLLSLLPRAQFTIPSPPGPPSPAPRRTSTVTCGVGSYDPNEKAGPSGAGNDRYLRGDESLLYSIAFENDPEATAPAQEVVVTDQLDVAKLDLSSFSLGPIRFGQTQVDVPPGLRSYSTDVDLRPARDLLVRINASLDETAGRVTWRLASLDPATGLPTVDPLAGFLPPNDNVPEGQGYLFYTINAKPGLPSGTEIRNRASIVFDTNPPIDTPEWINRLDSTPPSLLGSIAPVPNSLGWNNSDVSVSFACEDGHSGIASCPSSVTLTTEGVDLSVTGIALDAVGNSGTSSVSVIKIDKTKPGSSVAGLAPSQGSVDFDVSWAGADNGSGVAKYTIFVSEDGSPFSAWLTDTTQTSARFTGKSGSSYSFYSTAQDRAGNIEDAPAEPDATTRIALDTLPPETRASVSPNPNAAGWNASDVVVQLTAVDNEGGSGVREVTLCRTGPDPGPAVCTTVSGDSATVQISTEGATNVTFSAVDNAGNKEQGRSVMVRIDKTPPRITCSAIPTEVWPPNNKLVDVKINVAVGDDLSRLAGYVLTSVVSSDPNSHDDIRGFDVGQADTQGQLRAKRSGAGARTYTFTYTAWDVAGNSTVCVTTVTVPHDQRR